MSLDVSLILEACDHCGSEEREVYSGNVTHNLAEMAYVAGVYYACWRPREIAPFVERAADIAPFLRAGLQRLRQFPGTMRRFDHPNGWGDYDGLVRFVAEYLEACERYPRAIIRASR